MILSNISGVLKIQEAFLNCADCISHIDAIIFCCGGIFVLQGIHTLVAILDIYSALRDRENSEKIFYSLLFFTL